MKRDKVVFLDFETTSRSETDMEPHPFDPVNHPVLLKMEKTDLKSAINSTHMLAETSRHTWVWNARRWCNLTEARNLISYKKQIDLPLTKLEGVPEIEQNFIDKFFDDVHTIVAHSAKFEIAWMVRALLPIEKIQKLRVWCTQLGCYLMEGQQEISPSLKRALELAGATSIKQDGPGIMWKAGYDTLEIPIDTLRQYLDGDVEALRYLFHAQFNYALKNKHLQFFKDQMNALLANSLMSCNGMPVDLEKLDHWINKTEMEMDYTTIYFNDLLDLLVIDNSDPIGGDARNLLTAINKRKSISDLLIKDNIKIEKITRSRYKNGKPKTIKEEIEIEIENYDRSFIPERTKLLNALKIEPDKHGNYPVGDEVLEKLKWLHKQIANGLPNSRSKDAHERTAHLIETIQAWRRENKLLTTYLQPIGKNSLAPTLEQARRLPKGRYRIIYPNFNMAVTATGRLSSSKPNFQNQFNHPFKEIFVAWDGYELVEIDYNQLEIFVLAVLCQDLNLIDILKRGVDIHTYLFEKVYNRKPTKQERKVFKSCSFGLIYGSSAKGLMRSTGANEQTINRFIEQWFKAFPDSENYATDIKQILNASYDSVPTPGGKPRKRAQHIIPGGRKLTWLTFNESWGGEDFSWPQIKNYPIQSLASDIVKGLVFQLFKHIWEDPELLCVFPVNTVHDSVVFLVPKTNKDRIIKRLMQIMSGVKPWLKQRGIEDFDLPFGVEASSGPDWYNQHELEIE